MCTADNAFPTRVEELNTMVDAAEQEETRDTVIESEWDEVSARRGSGSGAGLVAVHPSAAPARALGVEIETGSLPGEGAALFRFTAERVTVCLDLKDVLGRDPADVLISLYRLVDGTNG